MHQVVVRYQLLVISVDNQAFAKKINQNKIFCNSLTYIAICPLQFALLLSWEALPP